MAEFIGRKVAKQFPNFGKKKFRGTVTDHDPNDVLAFHIKYDDGDEEDITAEELQSILVEEKGSKRKVKEEGAEDVGAKENAGVAAGKKAVSAAPARASASSKAQRGAKKAKGAEPAAAAAAAAAGQPEAGEGQAGTTAVAPVEGQQQGEVGARPQLEEQEGKRGVKAGPSGGQVPGDGSGQAAGPSGELVPRGGGELAPGDGGDKRKARPGSSELTVHGVAGSEDLRQLITEVAAKTKAQALNIVRHQAEGGVAGAAAAVSSEGTQPLRSDAVACGNLCFISTIFPEDIRKIEGDPQPAEELAAEYKRQVEQVLGALDVHLKNVGSSKEHLIYVTVMLKEVDKGTPPFSEVWNSWINPDMLPAMFVFESYMDREALVALTAHAAVPPPPPF